MSEDRGSRFVSRTRRDVVLGGVAAAATALLPDVPVAAASAPPSTTGTVHWAYKHAGGTRIRLFLWRKQASGVPAAGTILFVHGSSMASTPVFDLQVPGQPQYSVMDWFARLGYDTWCVDMEGYGRSDKHRPINADVATGADDIAATAEYIQELTGTRQFLLYGISSGSLRAALFAQRHPEQVARLALDAFVWTGEGSVTLAKRRQRLAEYMASNRRKISRDHIRSIFTRDHAGSADPVVVEAFADAILALDSEVPTGTYVDMSRNLPLCDPERITASTLILRGQYDKIAAFEDLTNFFSRLPNPDKQLIVLPGIAHSSLQEKNHRNVYSALHAFYSQPAPVYRG
ncbi:MAG TPA: alpha/beta hydrolase [Rhodocyclaceae bacterium]|nr:MAG: alpha/beta hydrolase [Rhodocyclales bacterium CG17_big_fil_post_rev_8_21_14_2_50_68_7]PIX75063.1 MAG: alpha/beta hydrolase [Rhodocyclales bacterium CG_4_10_14_3_um_filter_68_10]PJA56698.1 MAG: alpha/beta hydrolase [Rhodocyclales bacterium CG_4_9_14_3_um_filter_68_10]HCX33958.1 alpha/beta hydrolase [Rhodocyclaceae bacterium]